VISPGAQVEHAEFGIGKVLAVLGGIATVEFFGEKLDVDAGELVVRAGENGAAAVPTTGGRTTDLAFRRSFEAVNLGVVTEVSAGELALSMWSRETLHSVIDHVARHRDNGVFALALPVQRACEEQVLDGARVTVRGHRTYCGALAERAYMVALERNAGMPRERARAEAELRSRPQFRADVAAVVDLVYDTLGRNAAQLNHDILSRCMRLEDVVLH